nr:ABC transporter permease subunit [Anaerolineae bacterium]
MANPSLAIEKTETRSSNKTGARAGLRTVSRIARYTIRRMIVLLATTAAAVLVTILVANFGGYVDEIMSNRIFESVGMMRMGGWLRDTEEPALSEIMQQTVWNMEEGAGLHEPFISRTMRWWWKGITIDWEQSPRWYRYSGIRETDNVRTIIMSSLGRTLFIFGTANLVLFFASVLIALSLTRRHLKWLDKLVVSLSPISSAPAWVFGVILYALMVRYLHFTTGGVFSSFPDEFRVVYIPIMLKQLLLPLLAIVLSGIFQSIYTWRMFFSIFATEPYVELAVAKGLPHRDIERKYLLRPVLPNLLTSFALLLIVLWQEVIVLEAVFDVQGIGSLFLSALRSYDTPMVVGLVVTFSYLLSITVFFLDILYAIVDPRVKSIEGGSTLQVGSQELFQRIRAWIKHRSVGIPAHIREQRRTERRAARRLEVERRSLSAIWQENREKVKNTWLLARQYPSILVSLCIILFLLGMSLYAIIAIPYQEAIALWRGDNNPWYRNPVMAAPAWTNFFRREKLPVTQVFNTRDESTERSINQLSEQTTETVYRFPFSYQADDFPQDLVIYFETAYDEKLPFISIVLFTPDGREIAVTSMTESAKTFFYYVSQDRNIWTGNFNRPERELFTDPQSDPENPVALKGDYTLQITAIVFEKDATVDAEVILMGKLYGLAGTDHRRRDLMIGLLWGAPIALAFGLLAAVGTSVSTMAIAAIGTWFGGWVDGIIQRITEINMVLPFFPVSLMIFVLYSKSFWVILGVTVALSIFGNAIKSYRAIFLQVKESPYMEAAIAYGAGNMRLIFRYMIPRVVVVLIPQLVILVPSYVFLEATLAFLGTSDPVLPTWGKIVNTGIAYGAWSNAYHLILAPIFFLMLTGFAFVLAGFSLERMLDPRLRKS